MIAISYAMIACIICLTVGVWLGISFSNAKESELQDLKAEHLETLHSNTRMALHIEEHHDTFDEIYERLKDQKSGTARWVVKQINPDAGERR